MRDKERRLQSPVDPEKRIIKRRLQRAQAAVLDGYLMPAIAAYLWS
ncbi:MAG: hypothetical protein V2B18_23065 [Pseudomonadota bacterium]